jgi:transposase
MAKQKREVTFEEVVGRGCGLDIHKKEIVATVGGTDLKSETRSFQSTTKSLTLLKEWLLELGVTHVAMESTGVYWKPVMNILEPGGFTIMVVNARHIKYVPGHKTDKKDSAWICKLLRAGLLKGSFIPCREQRDLRDLTRYRRKLVQQQSAEHNRMIRIFEDANLKLSSVFSDIRGKTCTAVIDAVIGGETDPAKLAELCTNRCLKSSQEEIALAVEGRFTEHHKFMIHAIRNSIKNIEAEIEHLDKEIQRRMEPIEGRIQQLCDIPGLSKKSIRELLAEIGVDMEVFPTAEHLTSWAGLAPGNNESAGKKKSSHTNHGNKATKAIMTECAWCATRTKNTYFSAKYKRLVARRGKNRAIVAIAAMMLKVVYHMLKDGTTYQELGEKYLDDRRKQAQIRYHKDQLNKLLGEDSPETKSA